MPQDIPQRFTPMEAPPRFTPMDAPEPATDPHQLAGQAASQYQINPQLLDSMIKQESNWNQRAVSPKGAQGLMQLMPQTAKQMGVQDPFNPQQNIQGGAAYIKQLLDHYGGDTQKALAAYNAGEAAVDSGKASKYPETQNYVSSIMGRVPQQPRFTPMQAPQQQPASNWGWYEGVHKALTAPGTLFGPDQSQGPAPTFKGVLAESQRTGKDPEDVAEQRVGPYPGAQPIMDLSQGMQPGFGRGVAGAVSGLTSPASIAQLALLPESKLVNLGYGAQMGWDTAKGVYRGVQQQLAGNQPAANEAYGGAAVSGAMTGLAALGLREGKGVGEERFTRIEEPQIAPSISKQPAKAAFKSTSPAPSGLEALRAAKLAAGGEQPSLAIEGGPRPVSEHGLTAANQPGEAKGTAPSDTAFVGEKQAKIESQQVTGPNREAWVAQQRDFMIGKLQEVLRNPQVTPEERQVAQSMLDEFRQQAGVQQPQQQVAPQQPPRFSPIATPKPFEPAKTAPSQTRGAGIDTAKLLADQAAKGRISAQDSAATAQRAGVEPQRSQPQGKLEQLGKQVADLRERVQRPAGQGPTRNALPKQTEAERAADKELLERVQATQSTTPPKEPVPPAQAPPSQTSKLSARPATTEPVRGAKVSKLETKQTQPGVWTEDPAVNRTITEIEPKLKKELLARGHDEESANYAIAKLRRQFVEGSERYQAMADYSKFLSRWDSKTGEKAGIPLPESKSQPLKVTKDSIGLTWVKDPTTGHKVTVPSRVANAPYAELEAYARPKLAEQAQIHGGIKESLAAPQTPAKAPSSPVEARKGEGAAQEATSAQKPLNEAVKPKKPGEAGFLAFGGRAAPKGRAALASRMVSKRLDLTLQELAAPQGADYLRGVEALKESKGKQADYEAIYHNLEDPQYPLTPDQQRIKQNEVQDWLQEAERARNVLRSRSVPIDDYVHRIALARGAKLERVVTQGMKYSSGARLSKTASGLKARTMLGMDVPGLGRTIVHVKEGDVTAYVGSKEIPLGAREDLEAQGAKFGQATTKEIEKDTPQKYYKNALVSSILNTLELRRAERASDAMEEFKKDPDFKYVAKKSGTTTPPAGWQESQVPQLRGYSFEPRTREVLDRYWKDVTKGEPGAFEKINDWLRTSIFFNPLMHTKNIAVHWAVEKGVSSLLPTKWHGMIKDGIHAAQDVFSQNDNFKYALDSGAPLQSHRRTNREFESLLVSKMVQQMQGNKTWGQRMADTLGYANPAKLTKAIYDFSNKATWTFDDIMRLQATYQHMRENKTDFRTAMAEVNKHLPDYRIPTRILDSPELSVLMRNKNLTMFGAYHYGALKSYMEMAKDIVGKQVPLAQRAKALDRLAMLGLITAAFYPLADQLAKHVTGKQDARVDRSGASTFIDNLYKVMRGEKGLYSAGTAIATPAAGPQIAIRMAQNRALSMVSPQHTQPIGKQLWEATKDVGAQVGPVGQAKSAKFDWQRFFYGMLGVRYGATPSSRGGIQSISKIGGLKGLPRIK